MTKGLEAVDLKGAVLVTSFVVLLFPLCSITQFLGPVSLDLKRLEKCSEDLLSTQLEYKMHKVNRSHMGIDAFVNLPFDVDETVACNFSAAKWGDGGWKEHAMDVYDTNACKLMEKYARERLHELMTLAGLEKKCPIPAGKYNLTNYVFGVESDVPLMYGDFRIDLAFTKNDVTFICMRGFVKVEPKKMMG